MLWGRGAVDMKDMDAMILTALARHPAARASSPRATSSSRSSPTRRTAASYGSHLVVDDHPELFAGATEAISEVGGYSIAVGGTRAYLLQTGEKALVWIKLVARGTRRPRQPRASATTPSRGSPRPSPRSAAREWPVRLTDDDRGSCSASSPASLGRRRRGATPTRSRSRPGPAAGFIRSTLRTTTNPTGARRPATSTT